MVYIVNNIKGRTPYQTMAAVYSVSNNNELYGILANINIDNLIIKGCKVRLSSGHIIDIKEYLSNE